MDKKERLSLEKEYGDILDKAKQFINGRHDKIEILEKQIESQKEQIKQLNGRLSAMSEENSKYDSMFKALKKTQEAYKDLSKKGSE